MKKGNALKLLIFVFLLITGLNIQSQNDKKVFEYYKNTGTPIHQDTKVTPSYFKENTATISTDFGDISLKNNKSISDKFNLDSSYNKSIPPNSSLSFYDKQQIEKQSVGDLIENLKDNRLNTTTFVNKKNTNSLNQHKNHNKNYPTDNKNNPLLNFIKWGLIITLISIFLYWSLTLPKSSKITGKTLHQERNENHYEIFPPTTREFSKRQNIDNGEPINSIKEIQSKITFGNGFITIESEDNIIELLIKKVLPPKYYGFVFVCDKFNIRVDKDEDYITVTKAIDEIDDFGELHKNIKGVKYFN